MISPLLLLLLSLVLTITAHPKQSDYHDATDNEIILLKNPFEKMLIKHPSFHKRLTHRKVRVKDARCAICKSTVSALDIALRSKPTGVVFDSIAIKVCELLKKQCDNPKACHELCDGVIKSHSDEVLEIVTETVLAPSQACWVLRMCPKPIQPPHPEPDEPVIPSILDDSTDQPKYANWNDDIQLTGKFLHISDVHLDVLYKRGTSTQCGEPVCCREQNGSGNAGRFGDYACDTNEELFIDLLKYLKKLEFDFVVYTGDSPPHDIWSQSKEKNLHSIARINELLRQYMPNVQVLPTVGNHEAFPVNQYKDSNHDSWLYEQLANDWKTWLPSQAIKTTRYAGYYATLINPKLKLYCISINSNYYIDDNFWRKVSDYDVTYQFVWLKHVFDQIEKLNGTAIIIAHSSPIHWIQHFSDSYIEILNDYKHLIVNHFYGHTHTQDQSIIADKMAFIAGSITSFEINPGYTIVEYDTSMEDGFVKDYTQYWIDLPQSNKDDVLVWDKNRFSAKEGFGMKDMSTASWDDLADRMLENNDLFNSYIRAQHKAYPTSGANVHGAICSIRSETPKDYSQCMKENGQRDTKKRTKCDLGANKILKTK